MKILFSILTILTFLSSESTSQNFDWGLGLIKIDNVSSSGVYNIPEKGLEILDENQNALGTLMVKGNQIFFKTASEEKILDALLIMDMLY